MDSTSPLLFIKGKKITFFLAWQVVELIQKLRGEALGYGLAELVRLWKAQQKKTEMRRKV